MSTVSPCPECGALLLGETAARVADPSQSESCPRTTPIAPPSIVPSSDLDGGATTEFPAASPAVGTGRDGRVQTAVPRLREGFPPGTTSDPDPNGIGQISPG